MTQDEIIDMAKEASLTVTYIGDPIGLSYAQIAHFAKLVAAKAAEREREACAKVCEDLDYSDWMDRGWDQGTYDCAREIRARGNT